MDNSYLSLSNIVSGREWKIISPINGQVLFVLYYVTVDRCTIEFEFNGEDKKTSDKYRVYVFLSCLELEFETTHHSKQEKNWN